MKLKKKVSAKQHAELDDALKSFYIEKDGDFVLDLDGDDDTGELKRAKDRESQRRKEAETKARELQEKLDGLDNADARKKGDIETLEKSWQGKNDSLKAEYETKLKAKDAYLQKMLVDSVAGEISSQISKKPNVLKLHIKQRLLADLDGDEPKTKVLDKDGKPSAMTIEELKQEFVANDDFADIIIGSKATGSGAGSDGRGQPKGNGAANFGAENKPLANASPAELAAHLKANKQQ